MFEQLTGKLDAAFKKLRGQHKLTEENISESLREIRVALLSADVHFQTVKDFIASVKTKALGADVLQSVSPGQMIVKILHDEMVGLLGGEAEEPRFQGSPPVGILMMGLQGSGKTTACGKLALNLRDKLFLATKVWTSGRDAGIAQMRDSFRLMQAKVIDLMQVHNLLDTEFLDVNRWLYNQYAVFALRIDKKVLPAKLFQAHLQKRVQGWCAAYNRERCPSKVKQELREALELEPGKSYQMKIIRLVPDERKIGLSIRALKDDEYRADWEAYAESTGRPEVTLGDHFKNLK